MFVKAIRKHGKKWSKVAEEVEGRTATAVKRYAYRMRDKLFFNLDHPDADVLYILGDMSDISALSTPI